MTDVRTKYVPPSSSLTGFNCPHCGVLAKQFWYNCYSKPVGDDETPHVWLPDEAEKADFSGIDDPEQQEDLKKWVRKASTGVPFFDGADKYVNLNVVNVHASKCHNCGDIALWLHDCLMWPTSHDAPLPNPDLPPDVRADYEEAGTILNLSPRGAAALLRLAVQKLCAHLDEKGNNIDEDIASLVKKGLDVRVQKALDIVRVVGNNAVHPGLIDLKDDRATAEKLFGLINMVADIMITQPKHLDGMFNGLPEKNLKAIERRDAKKA
ncbi:hypothetical protein J2X72_003910 [Phyllobacterium sp. 1468]|uniref:DUF4145 domain-containing protein n=1 Tax=Phyllobacterium sp. 1468 TaxID=2817759 RepID=UPI00285B6A4E|nr:DUF4145 domain-containing protein [Phyllobacterium sp. 1468]MDR6635098.1 hypothetical protein [Phyllobacterium sp. 1468]